MGKGLLKATAILVCWTVAGYAEYRLQGGPPVLKVVKELKSKRKLRKQQVIQLKESEFSVA